jgi:hypothetical protein
VWLTAKHGSGLFGGKNGKFKLWTLFAFSTMMEFEKFQLYYVQWTIIYNLSLCTTLGSVWLSSSEITRSEKTLHMQAENNLAANASVQI